MFRLWLARSRSTAERAALLLIACAAACGQPEDGTLPASVRTASEIITAKQLESDAGYLASDALLGRDTPSPGLDSAAAFVVRHITELGLRPAGDDSTYLQHYTVRELVLDTAASFLELGGHRYRFGADFLALNFGDSATVDAPMSYVGHGVHAPKKNIDAFGSVDVKGRVVIAHGPQAYPAGESRQSLGATGIDWFPVQPAAAERGAAGLILINPATFVSRWSVPGLRYAAMTSRNLSPEVPSIWMRPTFPVLWVKSALAAALLAGAPTSAGDIMKGATERKYAASFDLPSSIRATIKLAARTVTERRPYNIVALIEGSDRRLRREVVTLGAHLDGAVGVATGGDSIFNAADDNASGSAGLLSIAAAMMKAPRPKRSVLFIWDTGEESGLWGSRFFAAHPPFPLANVVAHFNVDMIGRTKQPGTKVEGEEELAGPHEVFVVGPRVLSTDLDTLLERVNRGFLDLRLSHRFDTASHEYFYPRTDAAPMIERGVLSVDFFTGEHADYHAPSDDATRLDPHKMEQVSRTIFAAAWLLANDRARPRADKPLPPSVRRQR